MLRGSQSDPHRRHPECRRRASTSFATRPGGGRRIYRPGARSGPSAPAAEHAERNSMNVKVIHGDLAAIETPLLVVPMLEGEAADPAAEALDQALGGLIANLRARGDVRGKDNETLV